MASGAAMALGGLVLPMRLLPPIDADKSTPPLPIVVTVDSEPVDGAQPAQLNMQWEEGVGVLSPQWSGTVTAVFVKPGDTVRPGERVLAVDGVTRLAARTDVPFHRLLAEGSHGGDVRQLKQLLVHLGHMRFVTRPEVVYDAATKRAVDLLAAQLGLEVPVAAFDPAWLIWLPGETVALSTVEVVVGAPAPAAGVPIAVGQPALLAARVDARDPSSPLNLAVDREYAIDVSGTSVAIEAASGVVRPDGLTALASTLAAGTESLNVTLRYRDSIDAIAIPSSALIETPEATCVWRPVGGRFLPLIVDVVGGNGQTTYVTPGAPPDELTLVSNPGDVLGERLGCTSD